MFDASPFQSTELINVLLYHKRGFHDLSEGITIITSVLKMAIMEHRQNKKNSLNTNQKNCKK